MVVMVIVCAIYCATNFSCAIASKHVWSIELVLNKRHVCLWLLVRRCLHVGPSKITMWCQYTISCRYSACVLIIATIVWKEQYANYVLQFCKRLHLCACCKALRMLSVLYSTYATANIILWPWPWHSTFTAVYVTLFPHPWHSLAHLCMLWLMLDRTYYLLFKACELMAFSSPQLILCKVLLF